MTPDNNSDATSAIQQDIAITDRGWETDVGRFRFVVDKRYKWKGSQPGGTLSIYEVVDGTENLKDRDAINLASKTKRRQVGASLDLSLVDRIAGALLAIEEVIRQSPPPGKNGDSGESDGDATPDRQPIQVNFRWMRQTTQESIEALERINDPPRFFMRGSELCRLSNGEQEIQAEPLDTTALKGELDRAANYISNSRDGIVPARPPDDVCADLLALRDLPFPKLVGVTSVPVYTADGRLLVADGYDAASGIYVRLQGLDGSALT
jgi:hypothetical protein